MKNVRKLCALLFMLMAIFLFCMSASAETYRIDTPSGVNVRANPTSSSQRLGGVKNGVTVNVTGTSGDWLKIDYNGKVGYIYARYARKVIGDNNNNNNNNNSNITIIQSCNVRSAAGANNKYLGRANYGNTYIVLGDGKAPNNKLWYKINYNGKNGWVCSSFVKINNSSPSNPSNPKGKTKVFVGYFKLTAYCNCSKCCGKWAGGPTYSGTMPKEGRTIAVDKSIIPMGSTVIINGHEYIAEDTGSAIKGKIIDVYFAKHSDTYKFGVKYNVPVYIYK